MLCLKTRFHLSETDSPGLLRNTSSALWKRECTNAFVIHVSSDAECRQNPFPKACRWSKEHVLAYPASPLTGRFMSRVRSRTRPFLCNVVRERSELALLNSLVKQEHE